MAISRTTWLTGAVLLVAVGLAALLGGREAQPAPEVERARAHVEVTRLERRRLAGEVRAGGFLRAHKDATISAERAGRVAALPVAEGARVGRGEPVAGLDDTIAVANLERARTGAREAALQPDISAAELARAQEQLRLAEHELDLRHPVAPFAGVVEVHHIDVGEYVLPGAPLVDVIDAARLLLDVDVDAEVVGVLVRGGAAQVVVPALGDGAARAGTIERVASRADARTRRFRVEVAVPAQAGLPRPGMHAEARFEVPGGAEAFYVPKAATREIRGQRGVFLVVDGEARWQPVRVAEVYHRPDLWRIGATELEEGAMLVVAGFSGLRNGTRVAV
ncbi:MAG: efflux RND transporter periplasmic adaptor subunit, partial [Planctomycetota bacterium]